MALPAGQLRKFAQSLAPKRQEMKEARQTVHKVTLALQTHFRRRHILSRVTTFGSFRKKTSITNMMDVDMIVYISKGYPPFYEFINEIDELIQSQLFVNTRKDDFGLYFTYKGTKVDLLLAKNFLPPKGCRKAIVQHEKALEYVKSLPASERDKYSTSLSGVSVGFEKQRSSFSHSLSRLAKYWSKNVPVSNLRSPSCIMEYLGAWAAEKEGSSQDILSGFRYLLTMIINLDGMCVYWTEYYSVTEIPSSILSHRPLLLDPCNPYNNFMTLQNNEQYFQQMRKYARKTLQRIDEEERSYFKGKSVDWKKILSVFE